MAFIDWQLPSSNHGGGRMNGNEFSVIYNAKNRHSIRFNIEISDQVIAQGYSHVQIKQDDITGEIGFEFNNERGIRIKPSGGKYRNIQIIAKQWVAKVAIQLDLPTDGTKSILQLSKNLSTLDRCMFYRVLK